ncbi:MAG: hypothetical protein DRJ38_07235 [Thermoprotei archaeon]|nr:MAG: hypothetical protein DRJ38_07235 [Thermoprotei archaeon]
MSKKRRVEEAMMQAPETGEKFMALLLWAQSSSCTCPSCEYFRDFANRLISKHVGSVKKVGGGKG